MAKFELGATFVSSARVQRKGAVWLRTGLPGVGGATAWVNSTRRDGRVMVERIYPAASPPRVVSPAGSTIDSDLGKSCQVVAVITPGARSSEARARAIDLVASPASPALSVPCVGELEAAPREQQSVAETGTTPALGLPSKLAAAAHPRDGCSSDDGRGPAAINQETLFQQRPWLQAAERSTTEDDSAKFSTPSRSNGREQVQGCEHQCS